MNPLITPIMKLTDDFIKYHEVIKDVYSLLEIHNYLVCKRNIYYIEVAALYNSESRF